MATKTTITWEEFLTAGEEWQRWEWVDGEWVELPPNYRWAPSHWEQAPDGTSVLVPGRWVPNDAYSR